PLRQYADGPLGKQPDVRAALARDPAAMAVSLGIDVEVPGVRGGAGGGRVGFHAGPIDLSGVLVFADTPAHAPAIHLGGPLQVTFFGERPTFRAGRETELILAVGTPGTGPGTFAMLAYEGTIPDGARPVAEL